MASLLHETPQLRVLEYLDLTYCTQLAGNGDWLDGLGVACPKLVTLNLGGCSSLTDRWLGKIAAELGPRIKALGLLCCAAVSDAGVAKVASASPKLEWVSLAGCTRVSSAAVAELAAGCPRLRTLYLSQCRINGDDSAVKALAAGCPRLERLYGCHFSEKGRAALAQGCSFLELPGRRLDD